MFLVIRFYVSALPGSAIQKHMLDLLYHKEKKTLAHVIRPFVALQLYS